MAGRPSKQGLDYFSFDTDMDQDRKIQLLEANHPQFGWIVWTKLLPRLYRDYGYFFEANSENLLLFSRNINVDINSINAVINTAIRLDLFNADLYQRFRILSSKSIQDRFLHVSKRRKSTYFIKEFLLLSDSELAKCKPRVQFLIYDDINRIIVDNFIVSDYIKYASSVISYSIVLYQKDKDSNNHKGVSDFQNSEPEETQGQFDDTVHASQQIYDPKVPVIRADRPSVFNWSWEKAYFSQDKEWIASMAYKHSVMPDEIEHWFPAFFEWLELKNDKKSAEKMWSHFANWYPLRMEYMKRAQENKNKRRPGSGNNDADYDKPQW